LAYSELERNQGIGFEGEAGSHVGAWRPVQPVPVHVPMCGDGHGDGSCGVLGALFCRGFPTHQRPHLGRRAVLDPVARLHDDAAHCGTCSGIGVRHARGLLPQYGGLIVRNESILHPSMDEEDVREEGAWCGAAHSLHLL
jgi:hypothetical protein